MAGSFNKVLLMGNLTRDVELRHTPGGSAVARLGLACNRRFKTQTGEQRDEVTFVDCEAWGRTAEVMSQYLAKGRPVFIEGRLKLDQWQDKDGQNRSKLVVVVENFQFVDSREGGGGGPGGPGGSGGGRGRAGNSGYSGGGSGGGGGGGNDWASREAEASIGEDDIPF
ncbi:MAG: single-stranded DNA-binding protein [Phycisphaerales bacterium]|jgi:single-strand DNA-binding protein|nr:single-stranded DNA-binding protein [Phycisphaerales bacterium]